MTFSTPVDWLWGRNLRYGKLEPWVKLLLLLESTLKCNFWGPLTDWNFEPSPRAPTHSDTIIIKLCMDLTWHALNSMLQVQTLSHWKQGFGNQWLLKKITIEAEPSFRKASLPIAKLHILFPAYLWVREFWPQTFSFWQALDLGLLSKILASAKMNGRGPRMLKGQLSRVPWPGKCAIHTSSSLSFGHFSSLTNIAAHSS